MILGIDIGTTNVKIVAMPPGHAEPVAASVSAPLVTLRPEADRAEQDPEAVRQTVNTLLSEIITELDRAGKTVEAVCFSAGMHSLLAVDDAGQPLTNALLWADNRAQAEADALRGRRATLGRAIYRHTGAPIHPMLPLCKLAWFRTHQPDLLREAARWISLKEYVWQKLTGRYEIDWSMATATGLFDATTGTWHGPALRYAGVRPDQLANPVATTHWQAYEKHPPGVTSVALPPGVRLYIGASDGCLANIGAGAVGAGITTVTIGTSGAVRRTVNQPLRETSGGLFCYWLSHRTDPASGQTVPYYVVGGPTNNGGNVLDWLEQQFAPELSASDIFAEAATVPPGSDGLLFRPYLHGERAPLWDARVRGSFIGIDAQHRRAHFLRAALEGVLHNILLIERQLAARCGPTRVIHANGGFARSGFWVQMLADMAGVPVRLNASNESAAIGAVLLAQTDPIAPPHAPGSVETLAGQVPFGHTFHPDPAAHRLYAANAGPAT
jgi:gluconokinase